MGRVKKVKYKGIEFDSKLELNHYKYFLAHPKIKVLERQRKFTLLPSFKWFDIIKNKERVAREMVYATDFVLSHSDYDKPIAFESKGYARKDYMIRAKLFKLNYPEYYFVEVHSLKQLKEMWGDYGE